MRQQAWVFPDDIQKEQERIVRLPRYWIKIKWETYRWSAKSMGFRPGSQSLAEIHWTLHGDSKREILQFLYMKHKEGNTC